MLSLVAKDLSKVLDEAGTSMGSTASETNAASGGKDRMMGIGMVEMVAMGIAMLL